MGKFKFERYDYTKIGIGIFKSLKTSWSVELAKDINVFNNVNMEDELAAILSEQIAAEIDRSILNLLRNETF